MEARTYKARFLAGALAKLTFLAAIGIGPQHARPAKTADVAAATRPAVTRVVQHRDARAWVLGAASGDTPSNGTSSAGPGDDPAPGRQAETGSEE